jgi:hypothetical protein
MARFVRSIYSDVNCLDYSTEPRIPNPHLGEQVNRNIIQSEIEGGVYLRDLPIDGRLEIQTANTSYTLAKRGDGSVLLSGHPDFCPLPVPVTISGCTWGGSMLMEAFLGRGMHLEFQHPDYEGPITTSRIVEIRQVQ